MSIISESNYSLYKGTTNTLSIISSVNIAGSSNIVFSVKNSPSDSDDKSLIRIEYLNGLTIMNGSQYPIPSDASMSILDETSGNLEIVLNSNSSSFLIASQKRVYDIKARVGNEVKLISRGKIDLLPDVTNNI